MPWKAYHEGDEWVVRKLTDDGSKGEIVGRHGDDESKAKAQVRALYASEGGAMKKNTSHIIANEFREVNHAGRDWLVTPGVPARQQVMNGAFVPREEIGRSVLGWNGTAVTISHPRLNGGSANVPAPDVAIIGKFYNAGWDDGLNRMVGEYWIDLQEAEKYTEGKKIIEAIRNGKVLETSTGYYADDDKRPGVYDGQEYGVIHRNLLPDHIAILPEGGEIGACSVKDGCGVNRNMKHNCDCDCPLKHEMIVSTHAAEYKDGHLPTEILYPYSFNKGSRTPEQLAGLRKYIEENGIADPVMVMVKNDGNLKIVDGNHRVSMAYEMGIEQIPVELYDEDFQDVDPKIVYGKFLHSSDQDYLKSNKYVHSQVGTRSESALKKRNSKPVNTQKESPMDMTQLNKWFESKGIPVRVKVNEKDGSIEIEERVVETNSDTQAQPMFTAEEAIALKSLLGKANQLDDLTVVANFAKDAKAKAESERAALIATIKLNAANQFTDEELNAAPNSMLQKMAESVYVNYAGLSPAIVGDGGDVVVLVPPTPLASYNAGGA